MHAERRRCFFASISLLGQSTKEGSITRTTTTRTKKRTLRCDRIRKTGDVTKKDVLTFFSCLGKPGKHALVMFRFFVLFSVALAAMARNSLAEVLIVADEFPAMEFLAGKLKSEEKVSAKVVSQTEIPGSLDLFDAVVVYIHGALAEKVEASFIDYTRAGGKLVLLHHSISSGKRTNANWFSFLGVSLPEGDLSQGGYKWIGGVRFDLVNLNPNHFIMTNHVSYPARIAYATTNALVRDGSLPGFTLEHSEV